MQLILKHLTPMPAESFDEILELPWTVPSYSQRLRECGVRRETLLSVALVCKEFYEPSIAALWKILDNVSPLMSLIAYHPRTRSTSHLWVNHPLQFHVYFI